jgi:hypothetical protein
MLCPQVGHWGCQVSQVALVLFSSVVKSVSAHSVTFLTLPSFLVSLSGIMSSLSSSSLSSFSSVSSLSWEIGSWLSSFDYGRFEKNFRDNQCISLDVVFSLGEEDLKQIGIASFGDRRKISLEIGKLKCQHGPPGVVLLIC